MDTGNIVYNMKIKKFIFIVFVILTEFAFISALIYDSLKFNNQNEKISNLFIILLISGLIGPMFFLPAYFNSKETYSLPTAFVNYIMMIFESVTMLLGLTLYGNSIGSYGQFYLLVIYMFFGVHIFSYPKIFKSSLIQLVVPAGYIFLNIVASKLHSQTTLSSLEIIYTNLFKNGYIFTWSLIIGGLIVFGKFWYMSLNKNRYKHELDGVQNLKTLFIPFILFTVFIFMPGAWYMSHGFKDFFEFKGSLFVVLVDVVYFVYLIYAKGRNLSDQFDKFLTGKYKIVTSND
jgi:hypothetical protein